GQKHEKDGVALAPHFPGREQAVVWAAQRCCSGQRQRYCCWLGFWHQSARTYQASPSGRNPAIFLLVDIRIALWPPLHALVSIQVAALWLSLHVLAGIRIVPGPLLPTLIQKALHRQ